MLHNKLYSFLILLSYGRIRFQYNDRIYDFYNGGQVLQLCNFSDISGKVNNQQKEVLNMMYPGYNWDKIIKLYNEAPRSQK